MPVLHLRAAMMYEIVNYLVDITSDPLFGNQDQPETITSSSLKYLAPKPLSEYTLRRAMQPMKMRKMKLMP